MSETLPALLREIRACRLCAEQLPLGPRPVLQAHGDARILIASQAPGHKVHESGVPFDDASGERLRSWLGISRDVFYDARQIAIVPMGFCFPGTGKTGDLPPRPECAPAWRGRLMAHLPRLQLTLVIGRYAQLAYFPRDGRTLTELVRSWREHPAIMPLPHPSPLNNRWLKKHPWFEQEVLPPLRERVSEVLNPSR
ncbi:MAG TPA: uracil-DNA glycosylase family protein [Solimonas sp.]